MFNNSNVHSRVKHYDLLLSRELNYLRREHSLNLTTYQKYENAVRRETKHIPHLHQEPTECPSYRKSHMPPSNPPAYHLHQKRRLSSSTSSNASQNPTDDMDDDIVSLISSRQQRIRAKNRRLLPLIRSAMPERPKRKCPHSPWLGTSERSKRSKDVALAPFTVVLDEPLKPIALREPTALERQVRTFLDTLPTYRGVQNGFDNFAPASLYSHRAPVYIR